MVELAQSDGRWRCRGRFGRRHMRRRGGREAAGEGASERQTKAHWCSAERKSALAPLSSAPPPPIEKGGCLCAPGRGHITLNPALLASWHLCAICLFASSRSVLPGGEGRSLWLPSASRQADRDKGPSYNCLPAGGSHTMYANVA